MRSTRLLASPAALAALAALATACGPAATAPAGGGGGTAPTPPADPPAPVAAGALVRASLLAGDWQPADDVGLRVSWLRPGGPTGAIYGVVLQASPLVWVVDDEPGDGADGSIDDRALRLWQYDGAAPMICDEVRGADATAAGPDDGTLALRCADGQATMTIRRDGAAIAFETRAGTTTTTARFTPAAGPGGLALEDADRAFDAATSARGPAGWVDAFAPDGVMWTGADAAQGADAIRAAITPVLVDATLRWEPKVGRLSADGQLGATAGTWVSASREAPDQQITGTYITVWRKLDGAWKVIFDVGRPDR
ncbi:MAG: nuclear transport factor 2 family protein [Kofleriaceae bacterium]|nr:nuclear transport factor 2 family protein [Kofleriaceae bacterium]